MTLLTFADFYTLDEQGSGAFCLGITSRKTGRRFRARQRVCGAPYRDEWCAAPREIVGDAPDKYHPLYVVALLTALSDVGDPRELRLPAIAFSTDADTRRSMTLNAMRMTCEYSHDASPRILRLVSQRLEAGQRDVVHDALVYVMRQILSLREAMHGEQALRAQALAAYLGVSETALPLLSPRRDALVLETLRASTRRAVDIEAVVEMQRRILRAALVPLRRAERHQLGLLDRIVALLKNDDSPGQSVATEW
jgi:hypothetical protein